MRTLKLYVVFVLLLLCLSPVQADTDVQISIPNASFELDADMDLIPDGWTAQGFTALDGRECSESLTGLCSLYLHHHLAWQPNRGSKSLSILVDADVPANVWFHAQIFAKAEDLPANGAKFIVSLLDNGVVSQSFTATFESGTYNWRVLGDLFYTTAAADQMSIKVTYFSNSGFLRLDTLSAGYITPE